MEKPLSLVADRHPTLEDILARVRALPDLSRRQLLELEYSVASVAKIAGGRPDMVPLDIAALRVRLSDAVPSTFGLAPKTFANIKSGFRRAVRLSGLSEAGPVRVPGLSPAWKTFIADVPNKGYGIGLSRLAAFASANQLSPHEVNDETLDAFVSHTNGTSLRAELPRINRELVRLWNKLALDRPNLALRRLTQPVNRRHQTLIPWEELPPSLVQDTEEYLQWCNATDPFSENARARPLAPETLRTRRGYIKAAATAVINSGGHSSGLTSLAELTSVENIRRMFKYRYDMTGGRNNDYNYYLGYTLVQIAREWVRVDPTTLESLKKLLHKLPHTDESDRMTEKNREILRQFKDPELARNFIQLPEKVFHQAKRDTRSSRFYLASAQAALALAILMYMPLRLVNLTSLAFGRHLHLQPQSGGTSTLEIPEQEVKNRTRITFDIPDPVAVMLREYRDHLAPKAFGYTPERLFVNVDGTGKSKAAVRLLIQKTLQKRLGISFTPHAARHLAGMFILDESPGAYELVKQLLGHKRIETTVAYYTGIDTRRAGAHHQGLLEKYLSRPALPARKVRKFRSGDI